MPPAATLHLFSHVDWWQTGCMLYVVNSIKTPTVETMSLLELETVRVFALSTTTGMKLNSVLVVFSEVNSRAVPASVLLDAVSDRRVMVRREHWQSGLPTSTGAETSSAHVFAEMKTIVCFKSKSRELHKL